MKNLSVIFILFVLAGCSKDYLNEDVSIFGYESPELARQELGNYYKFFLDSHATALIEVTTYKSTDRSSARIFGGFQESFPGDRVDGGSMRIGDLELVMAPEYKQYIPAEGNLNSDESYERIKSFFGKTVDLYAYNKGNEIHGSFYVPKDIIIDYPDLETHPKSNAFTFSVGDKKISWNKDIKNENGVVLHLYHDGFNITSLDKSLNKEDFVERAIVFDDTGKGTIPADFFNGLEKGDVFTLYFIRGGIDILEDPVTKRSFKFYVFTEDKFNFIME